MIMVMGAYHAEEMQGLLRYVARGYVRGVPPFGI